METSIHRVISLPVSCSVVLEPEPSIAIPTRLTYDTREPHTASLEMMNDGDTIVWSFGRDLLIAGVDHAAGLGDVRVFPFKRHFAEFVRFTLSSPDGSVVLEIPARQVKLFVTAMTDFVPLGEEGYFAPSYDLDNELAELLKSS